jgi:aminopeptidase
MQTRASQLANIFVNHSLEIKKGDKVVISLSSFDGKELIQECYKQALQKGAIVYLDVFGTNFQLGRADALGLYNIFINNASTEHLQTKPEIMDYIIDWGDKFLRIGSVQNTNFLTNLDPKKQATWHDTYYQSVFKKMIRKDWVLTQYPTIGVAQNANMSLEEFEDYYYQASIVDYQQMDEEILPLQDIMDQAKQVHIYGDNVDLKLGIEGRLAAGIGSGKHNVPDGECFIGPEEDKTEGYIKFDLPQNNKGRDVMGIYLEFSQGRVVKYSAEQGQEYLDSIFENNNNRILGELGIGTNKFISKYIKNILYDEKIYGTIHIALGSSYENERGGGKNKATIHWDLIKDLRHQGSFIKMDNKVIMQDGKFVF